MQWGEKEWTQELERKFQRRWLLIGGVSSAILACVLYFLEEKQNIWMYIGLFALFSAIISLGTYIEAMSKNLSSVEHVLAKNGLLKILKGRVKFNMIFRALPKEIESGNNLVDITRSFRTPPILGAYELYLSIDIPKMQEYLQLDSNELAQVRGWTDLPESVVWERWSGGYERVRLSLKDISNKRTYDREFSYFQGFPAEVREAWSGSLGEGQVVLEIREDRILMAGKYGRFGVEQTQEHRFWNPMQQWILMDIPLSEKLLEPFSQTRQQSIYWQPQHGRPCKRYHHGDNGCGIEWELVYYFDLRPLFLAHVCGVARTDPGRCWVELDFYGTFPTGGGSHTFRHVLEDDMGLVKEGDQVYAVFSSNGEIERLWPKAELQL